MDKTIRTIRITAARGCIGGSTADALNARGNAGHVRGRNANGTLPTAARLAPPVRVMIRRARLSDTLPLCIAAADWPTGEAIRLAMERDAGAPCRVTIVG